MTTRMLDGVLNEIIVRADDPVSDLVERVRMRVHAPAPIAVPKKQPSPEEWAAWARENLSEEDASVFEEQGNSESATAC